MVCNIPNIYRQIIIKQSSLKKSNLFFPSFQAQTKLSVLLYSFSNQTIAYLMTANSTFKFHNQIFSESIFGINELSLLKENGNDLQNLKSNNIKKNETLKNFTMSRCLA